MTNEHDKAWREVMERHVKRERELIAEHKRLKAEITRLEGNIKALYEASDK